MSDTTEELHQAEGMRRNAEFLLRQHNKAGPNEVGRLTGPTLEVLAHKLDELYDRISRLEEQNASL
jgi:hypothetical protein